MANKSFILVLIATLLLAACAAAPASEQGAGRPSSGAPPYEVPPGAPAPEMPAAEAEGRDYASPQVDVQRVVITNAEIELVVNDASASMDAIAQMAEQMGGYVVYAQLYQRTVDTGVEVPQANLTIRVPAARLDEALDRIASQSDREPVRRNINSQDVTREYVDLQSRLRNLEAAESQLQAIMLDARRTEDVLAVYSELTRVREQIEVIKGQIQYYDQASALSSISINLVPNEAVQPITVGRWEPTGVARTAIQALVNSLTVLASSGIWVLLYLLPLVLILALPVLLVVLVIRRLRRRPKGPLAPRSAAE